MALSSAAALKAPRRCDLVLKIRKLALQLLEILIGLEVGIGFGQGEDLAQCALQLRLGGRPSCGTLRADGGVAGFDDVLQRLPLVCSITLDLTISTRFVTRWSSRYLS